MRTLAATILLLALAASGAAAQGWRAAIPDHTSLPSRFAAIDKSRQTFFLLGQHSPLVLEETRPCTTGREPGDKQVQGDLRTPEGIYFLAGRITRPLDFTLYGDRAWALNFPNPVDRIKGKTGGGIWVHGRGEPLTPRDTRGCVALDNPDLAEIDHDFGFGMPVIIAQSLEIGTPDPEFAATASALRQRVASWARAWQNKSDEFFDLYDQGKFELSTGVRFSAFQARKKSIFATHPWLHVLVDDIRVVPGPDYWVTYFSQLYRTSGLLTQGLKRLYWQQDEAGDWRIVGRELIRTGQDLMPAYLERLEARAAEFLESWRKAWLSADPDAYREFYAPGAVQQKLAGVDNIIRDKLQIWAEAAPAEIVLGQPRLRLHPTGVRVDFTQSYTAQDGYHDYGSKTLVLQPLPRGWRIIEESWRKKES